MREVPHRVVSADQVCGLLFGRQADERVQQTRSASVSEHSDRLRDGQERQCARRAELAARGQLGAVVNIGKRQSAFRDMFFL